MNIHPLSDTIKNVVDTLSTITVIGALTQWLPPIASLLSIIWMSLRIWEMVRGKPLGERRREKQRKPGE